MVPNTLHLQLKSLSFHNVAKCTSHSIYPVVILKHTVQWYEVPEWCATGSTMEHILCHTWYLCGSSFVACQAAERLAWDTVGHYVLGPVVWAAPGF